MTPDEKETLKRIENWIEIEDPQPPQGGPGWNPEEEEDDDDRGVASPGRNLKGERISDKSGGNHEAVAAAVSTQKSMEMALGELRIITQILREMSS